MLVLTIEAAARRRVTPALAARVKRRAAHMVVAAAKGAEVGLTLTGDAGIHALNRLWRHKDKPTDVLAFAMTEGAAAKVAREAGLLGDVVISVATAARQAAERGVGLGDELEHLFAHGLCHLLGYDHRDDEEERVMNARMARLLKGARGGRRGKSPERARARARARARGVR